MRNALISALFLLALVACGDGEGSLQAHISATVDGKRWTAIAAPGFVIYPPVNPDDSGFVHTSGLARAGDSTLFFSLSFPNPPKEGSYALDNATAFVDLEFCPTLGGECTILEPVPGHPGTLRITLIDPATGVIEGDFSYPGYSGGIPDPSRSVTQGRFAFLRPGG